MIYDGAVDVTLRSRGHKVKLKQSFDRVLPVSRWSSGRGGVAAIAGGTAIGQAVAIALSPVLSRLYTPTDFGVFTIMSSIVAVVSTVAALRMDLAIVLPKADRDAVTLAALGLISISLTTVVGFIVIAVFGSAVAALFSQPSLRSWLWLVPIAAALMAAYLLLNQLAIRHQRYSAIGRRNLLQSIATVVTQLSLGLAGLQKGGLIVGLAVGQLVSVVSLLGSSRLLARDTRSGLSPARFRPMLSRYRRFPLLSAPSGLLNVAGLQLPVLMITFGYGAAVGGWLGLTQRVLSFPVMLLGSAVAQVYVGRLASSLRADNGGASRIFWRASRHLSVVAAAMALIIFLTGPPVFAGVFGAEWRMSGEFARALSVALAIQLLAAPVSQTLMVFERQWSQLAWDAGRLVLLCSAVAISMALGAEATVTIWVFSAGSALAYLATWLLAWRTIARAARQTDGLALSTEPSS